MPPVDENLRRYYLDAMGIQCWELLDSTHVQPQVSPTGKTETESNMEVAVDEVATMTEARHHENSVESMAEESMLDTIQQSITSCQNCDLYKTRQQAIAGRGKTSADILILLLSPSREDDAASTICSGEENDLLNKMLAAIQLELDDIYITSLLKCTVPETYTIRPKEVGQCMEHLNQQIAQIQPKLVFVMGDIAARCLLQKNIELDALRGTNASKKYSIEDTPLFFSYSPQELIESPENKRKSWADLQQLQKMLVNL